MSSNTHDAPLSRTPSKLEPKELEKDNRESFAPTEAPTIVDENERYLTGSRLFLVFVGMLMSILLIALDQTIVATALPIIASKFDAFNQVTWIGTLPLSSRNMLDLTPIQLAPIS
ncbi:hypothetical protein FRC09_001006 [Ceratobasidium sp. 395]|nr:hypothetical protein FRC09_001006 [Ceratobasidium sp. 395]